MLCLTFTSLGQGRIGQAFTVHITIYTFHLTETPWQYNCWYLVSFWPNYQMKVYVRESASELCLCCSLKGWMKSRLLLISGMSELIIRTNCILRYFTPHFAVYHCWPQVFNSRKKWIVSPLKSSQIMWRSFRSVCSLEVRVWVQWMCWHVSVEVAVDVAFVIGSSLE